MLHVLLISAWPSRATAFWSIRVLRSCLVRLISAIQYQSSPGNQNLVILLCTISISWSIFCMMCILISKSDETAAGDATMLEYSYIFLPKVTFPTNFVYLHPQAQGFRVKMTYFWKPIYSEQYQDSKTFNTLVWTSDKYWLLLAQDPSPGSRVTPSSR